MYVAKDFSFGAPAAPRSGFMPIIAGTLASILALINFINVMRKKTEGEKIQIDFKKITFFTLGMVAYLIMMKYIGYLASTFIALLYLLKVTEVKGWIKPLIISAATAGGFYLIFAKFLGVMFP